MPSCSRPSSGECVRGKGWLAADLAVGQRVHWGPLLKMPPRVDGLALRWGLGIKDRALAWCGREGEMDRLKGTQGRVVPLTEGQCRRTDIWLRAVPICTVTYTALPRAACRSSHEIVVTRLSHVSRPRFAKGRRASQGHSARKQQGPGKNTLLCPSYFFFNWSTVDLQWCVWISAAQPRDSVTRIHMNTFFLVFFSTVACHRVVSAIRFVLQ